MRLPPPLTVARGRREALRLQPDGSAHSQTRTAASLWSDDHSRAGVGWALQRGRGVPERVREEHGPRLYHSLQRGGGVTERVREESSPVYISRGQSPSGAGTWAWAGAIDLPLREQAQPGG